MQNLYDIFERVHQRTCSHIGSAPGRVNIMGDHTDYNGGWVMPMPLPLHVHVAVAARQDTRVRIASQAMASQCVTFDLDRIVQAFDWADYCRGLCAELLGHGLPLRGFDALIVSEVPSGAGLSSSAALQVALGRALRACFGLSLDDMTLSRLVQRCENTFVGAHVGIMDPLAASLGRPDQVLLLNTDAMNYAHIAWPKSVDWAVIHSGLEHALADGAYNSRRQECEEAAGKLGVDMLCQLKDMRAVTQLAEPLRRRTRHVLRENRRVHAAAEALRAGDAARLGQLFAASHASLRDDYEVSVPAVDALVAAAEAHPNAVGARMTGGGFGGCVVVLAGRGHAAAVARDIVGVCRHAAPKATVVLPVA